MKRQRRRLTDKNWRSMLGVICSARMLVALVMGFSSGLPLLLTMSVLQAWMKKEGVDLTVIGLMSVVGIPYSVKFLWAPLMDRYTIPFLMGRRRGWLLMAQASLIIAIACMGKTDPRLHPFLLVIVALLVTFFSASQDIVVDAYRREDIPDEELGFASSLYINGYRIGMLLASGGGLILADHVGFAMVYMIMAACMLPGLITTLLAPEPEVGTALPESIRAAVIDPLAEYFSRSGALWILAFIFLYKVGDTMATTMTIPFYLDIGFTNTQIGTIVKLFGFWATIGGAMLGGVLTLRIGIYFGLWVFGILQGLSTLGFAWLATVGNSVPALAGVIAFENLCSGMGTAAFVAFMALLTNKKFTATQYALLSSLMALPRVLAGAPTGYMVDAVGWKIFFIECAILAIPGLLILLNFTEWRTASSFSQTD